nr:unnamed protein product [Callosobruchus analis]
MKRCVVYRRLQRHPSKTHVFLYKCQLLHIQYQVLTPLRAYKRREPSTLGKCFIALLFDSIYLSPILFGSLYLDILYPAVF